MCLEFVWGNLADFPFFQPMYKKFTENKWDSSSEIMNEIIKTTSKHISDFQTLKDPFYHVSPREILEGFWGARVAFSALIPCGLSCLDLWVSWWASLASGSLSGKVYTSMQFTPIR